MYKQHFILHFIQQKLCFSYSKMTTKNNFTISTSYSKTKTRLEILERTEVVYVKPCIHLSGRIISHKSDCRLRKLSYCLNNQWKTEIQNRSVRIVALKMINLEDNEVSLHFINAITSTLTLHFLQYVDFFICIESRKCNKSLDFELLYQWKGRMKVISVELIRIFKPSGDWKFNIASSFIEFSPLGEIEISLPFLLTNI